MQKKLLARWALYLLVILILLVLAALLSLAVGEITIRLSDIPAVFRAKEGMEYVILTKLRIPRIVLAIAIGGSLSLAGTLLQGIYRNPLVEPYTMGISGGGAFGVAICIVLGLHLRWGSYLLPVFGFLGALATIFMVYTLGTRKSRGLSINRMLLIGVMISFIASSGMLFLMALSSTESLHSIIFWTMGSLNEPNTGLIGLVLVISILGLLVSYGYVTPLNALRLGETKAQHLGINTSYTIKVLFVVASVITGVSVAVAGVIGFVGLVIPHLMRRIVGTDYRILLISSFFGGAVFMMLSDLLARTLIAPNELPIGVITGIVGGVMFIVALSSMYSKTES